MMFDNAALYKEKIMQEHFQAKHIHSERIRLRKTQFVSEEKEKYRIETSFTHISLLLYFGMFMPTTENTVFFCCSWSYYLGCSKSSDSYLFQ